MHLPALDPARVRDRVATAVAVGALTALAVVTWRTSRPLAWERPILTAVGRVPFPTRDFWIAMFEPLPAALVTTALACAAVARGRFRIALGGLAGCLAAVVAAEVVLKPIVGRARTHVVGPPFRVVQLGGHMFPSAHVTAAAAFATFAVVLVGRRSRLVPLLCALPLVVGAATMSKHMHDPADVLGGLILGPLVVAWTVALTRSAGGRLGLRRFETPDPARTGDAMDAMDAMDAANAAGAAFAADATFASR